MQRCRRKDLLLIVFVLNAHAVDITAGKRLLENDELQINSDDEDYESKGQYSLECDCGRYSNRCFYDEDGNKKCVCYLLFFDANGTCSDCKCGLMAITCEFDEKGNKICICFKGYADKNGTCTGETTTLEPRTTNDSGWTIQSLSTNTTGIYFWTSAEPLYNNTTYAPLNVTYDLKVSTNGTRNFTQEFETTTIKPAGCRTDRDCLNGGTCRNVVDEYFCDCPPNFRGEKCEINLCSNLEPKCMAMGAICQFNGYIPICECPPGKVYRRKTVMCEDICDSGTCMHGKCEVVGRLHICKCHESFTGFRCDEIIGENKNSYKKWFIIMFSVCVFMFLLITGILCLICRK